MSESPDLSPSVDLDHLLRQEDPDFVSSLEAVRTVENASDVHIEASALDPDGVGEDEDLNHAAGGGVEVARLLSLKTLPRDLVGYALAQVKYGLGTFKAAPRGRKLLILTLILVAVASVTLSVANLRGTWVPALNQPPLTGFARYADRVDAFDAGADQVSLAAEFPPERYEFLFKPFKVNLRPTAENPQPMGAFEFVVTLDREDTAIEARDREVEFVDLIQRVFEDETFHDLATELGKGRLKSRLQRELNAKLATGRVTDVNFKTFVLKP